MPYIGKQPVVGNFVKLDAITTSATDTFPLTNGGAAYTPQSVNQMIVSLNGVIQAPTDAFTLSGSNIVFASTLSASDVIDFILVFGDTLDIGTPSDDTVSAIKIKTNAVTEAKINTGAVTETKLGTGSVTADKIGSGAVTTAKLGPAAVTAPTIAPGTITTTQISPAVKLGVPAVASDPPTPSLSIGDLWFNTSANKLRAWGSLSATLSAGAAFPTPGYVRYTVGPQTNANAVGGINGPTNATSTAMYSYDGSAWNAETAMPYPAYGVFLSANAPGDDWIVAAGRSYPTGTVYSNGYSYDGSTFSGIPSLSSARYIGLAGGPSTAMTVAGGDPGAGNREDYNGTSWASGTMLPVSNHVENGMNLVGPASDLTVAGGRDGTSPFPGQGYNWDGTTWTTFPKAPSNPGSNWAGNNINFGSSSSNLYSGLGEYTGGKVSAIDLWDGTSWTSSVMTYPSAIAWAGASTAGNSGSSGSGVIVGGSDTVPNQLNTVQEYSWGLGVININ
jgi:hypothetical protein